MGMFELGDGRLDPPQLAPQAARQPVVLAQSVEHRAADALRRVGLELRAETFLVAVNRVEQAEHAVLNEIVELDIGRQAGHQVIGDPLHQRHEALNQLFPVRLPGGGIHQARMRFGVMRWLKCNSCCMNCSTPPLSPDCQ